MKYIYPHISNYEYILIAWAIKNVQQCIVKYTIICIAYVFWKNV